MLGFLYSMNPMPKLVICPPVYNLRLRIKTYNSSVITVRMAIIVRGRVPATEFALAETLSTLSDVAFEVEKIVESGTDAVMPLLWARGADHETVTSVFDDDPSVREVELLSDFGDEHLYRMEWISEIELVLQMLTTAGATIMEAFSGDMSWSLRVLYPTRNALTETSDYCDEKDLTFDIKSVHEMEGDPAGRYGLSEVQYRAFTAAAEAGYYHVPRDITMQALAEELGVSHQALSERLRRAVDTLAANTVLTGPPSDE